jgi:hypothetical protein
MKKGSGVVSPSPFITKLVLPPNDALGELYHSFSDLDGTLLHILFANLCAFLAS